MDYSFDMTNPPARNAEAEGVDDGGEVTPRPTKRQRKGKADRAPEAPAPTAELTKTLKWVSMSTDNLSSFQKVMLHNQEILAVQGTKIMEQLGNIATTLERMENESGADDEVENANKSQDQIQSQHDIRGDVYVQLGKDNHPKNPKPKKGGGKKNKGKAVQTHQATKGTIVETVAISADSVETQQHKWDSENSAWEHYLGISHCHPLVLGPR
ncbi:hypothetical protein N0V82_001803 [Gnomoniopsis sp. IMI 355080]|nr:hypothetical protein N0V82_001803 [Gnomoniopsis sp. IMI 355080]